MAKQGMQETGAATPPRDMANTLNDLNHPLTAIDNYVQAGRHLLERGYADEEKLAELFDKLAGQVSRCQQLARELRRSTGSQAITKPEPPCQ